MSGIHKLRTKDGIPTIKNYLDLIESNDFKEVEAYSDKFIGKVGEKIQSYNNKWVPDPLHQWSRQWEYIYIIDQVLKTQKARQKVLDLGAGMTFLPYYLQELKNVDTVTALDYDASLAGLYDKVNKALAKKVEFRFADIRKLAKEKTESYDYIYSVSVLEHTDNYGEIVKNCYKLLKKGGKFSITFDISLDGNDDIPLKKAGQLMDSIQSTFKLKKDLKKLIDVEKKIVRSDEVIKNISKDLMPWKYPLLNVIKPMLKKGRPGSRYKKLTFCCVSVKKS